MTYGANASIDTRGDPAFPSNAVYAFGGWRALDREGGPPRIGIVRGDLRGYWRAIVQTVVAARVQYEGADRTLPDYERLLIGGASSLRGTRVGADAAKAYDAGQRSAATPWSSGAGAGAFMTLRFISANVHFAHSLNGTGNRIHLSTGFTF